MSKPSGDTDGGVVSGAVLAVGTRPTAINKCVLFTSSTLPIVYIIIISLRRVFSFLFPKAMPTPLINSENAQNHHVPPPSWQIRTLRTRAWRRVTQRLQVGSLAGIPGEMVERALVLEVVSCSNLSSPLCKLSDPGQVSCPL